jgi:hypothetical protein
MDRLDRGKHSREVRQETMKSIINAESLLYTINVPQGSASSKSHDREWGLENLSSGVS